MAQRQRQQPAQQVNMISQDMMDDSNFSVSLADVSVVKLGDDESSAKIELPDNEFVTKNDIDKDIQVDDVDAKKEGDTDL